MRRLAFHLLAAFLTFSVGVTAASLWAVNHLSSPLDIPPPEMGAGRAAPLLAKPKTPAEDRDLTLYDFGGRQGCGSVGVSETRRCDASIRRARAFIWRHWQEQRRGYVIVKRGGDHAESDAHIFIEPSGSGVWRVVWRWEGIFGMWEDVAGRIDDLPEIRAVERRRATDNTPRYEPGTTFLLFIGGDDEVVTTL